MLSQAWWQVRPAPDWPPEVDKQYRAHEWILYRLRRAYTDADPQRPARDLLSAGALPAQLALQIRTTIDQARRAMDT